MRLALRVVTGAQASRWWRALFVALLVAVTLFALVPAPPLRISTGWDKLNHVLAFAALTLSGCLAHAGSRRTLAIVFVGLLAYGGLIEVVQMFVPNRSAEWGDMLANAIGVACGALSALAVCSAVQRTTAATAGPGSGRRAP